MTPQRLFALDNNALRALLPGGLTVPKARADAAKYFWEHVVKPSRAQIVIPAPVVHEYLCGCKVAEQREQAWFAFRTGFVIGQYGAEAAEKAAELWHERYAKVKDLKKGTRHCLKADLMIVAIAAVMKVDTLFSYDGDLELWAQGRVLVKPFDAPPKEFF